jgi:hypothetical protein
VSYDAGSIESRLELDRTPFQEGLRLADEEASRLDGRRIAPVVDLDTARAQRSAKDVADRLRELGALDARPQVHVATGEASAEILRLKAELDSLHDETVRVRVDQSGGGAGGQRTTSGSSNFGNASSGLVAGGLALAPSLIPVAGVLTAGVGALASAFTAAGVGAVGFGLLAKPQLEAVADAQKKLTTAQAAYNTATTDKGRAAALLKEQQILAALTPAQREYMAQLNGLKGVYKELQASVATSVFTVAAKGIDALATGGRLLEPVFQAAGDTFVELAGQFDTWIKSSAGAHEFINFLTRETGPAIYTLVHGLANIAAGFGGILYAFEPMIGPVEGGLTRLSEKFAAWGKGLGGNAGFQAFLDYVRENGPQVGKTLEDLARAGGTIVTQLAPFGPIGLRLLDVLAKLIDKHPELVNIAAAVLLVGKATSGLGGAAGNVVRLTNNFAALAKLFGEGGALAGAAGTIGSLGLAGIALGATVLVAYEVYTHWHEIVGFIERDWKNLLLLFPVFGPALSLLAHNWSATFNGIKTVTRAALGGIVDILEPAADALLTFVQGIIHVASLIPSPWQKSLKQASHSVQDFKHDLDNTFDGIRSSLDDKGGAAGRAGGKALAAGLNQNRVPVANAAQGLVSATDAELAKAPHAAGVRGGQTGQSYGYGIGTAGGSVVGAAQGIVAQASSALTADVSGAGRSLINSYGAGIAAAAQGVVAQVNSIMASIKGLMPQSPAKWGPFAGAGAPHLLGAKLAQSYADGLAAGAPMVATSAAAMAAAARASLSGGLPTDLLGNGGGRVAHSGTSSSGPRIVQNNYLSYAGPTPAEVIQESQRRLDFAMGA